MKKLSVFLIFFIALNVCLQAEQYIPSDVQRVIDIRKNEIKKIDEQYCAALDKLKRRYTKVGELEYALLVDELIKENKSSMPTFTEINVRADRPKATGIMLKKGQKFSLEPNREDKWGGGGTKKGVLCDYMGYDDRGNTWMRMMFRVGKEEGSPVKLGHLQFAKQDGELTIYAFDGLPAGNTGEIRVSITVNPE